MRPLLALLLILACAGLGAAADNKPEAPRIAVLRLADALPAFKMYSSGMDKLKKDLAEGQAKIKQLEDHLQDLEGKLQVMKKDSPNYKELSEEFEVTKLRGKMLLDNGNDDLSRRHIALMTDVFATLRASLATFCQERGIKLVHLAPRPDLNARDGKELDQALSAQTVLYFDPSLDITDAFVVYLNQQWEANGAKSASPAPDAAPAKDAPAKDAAPALAPAPAPTPAPAPGK
jgi:Skp family chaperone for outer membrane proteins